MKINFQHALNFLEPTHNKNNPYFLLSCLLMSIFHHMYSTDDILDVLLIGRLVIKLIRYMRAIKRNISIVSDNETQ